MKAREPYDSYRARARRSSCYKPWTVLVYMAADNDLAPYAAWDLYEMEAGYESGKIAAGSTRRSDLLVQLAMPGATASKRIHVFQAEEPYDGRLKLEDFRARLDSGVRSPVAALGPRSDEAGKPADDLQRFLEWGIREYPAERYMVVVWGHGQGWAPSRSGSRAVPLSRRRFGGLAFSDSQGTFLDIPSLRKALRAAESRQLEGRRIDVYASDACLMQMVEVAAEISDSARFIVGSSQVQNFLGLPYRRMMYELNTGGFLGEKKKMGDSQDDDEAYLLARMLPRLFRMSLEPQGLHGRHFPEASQTVTMSALSSDELRNLLVPSMETLGAALEAYLREAPIRAIDLQAALSGAPSFMGGSKELGATFSLIRNALKRRKDEAGDWTQASIKLDRALASASSALDRTVLSYALGTRYKGVEGQLHLLGLRAFSAWLPSNPSEYEERVRDFASSRFYRSGAWPSWLARLHAPAGIRSE